MKRIPFDSPHRRKHFEFFNRMDQPHFSICAEVGVISPDRFQPSSQAAN